MSKVMHFEIPIDDPDRAAGFYRDALGWEISRFGDEPYWLVRAGQDEEPGANGALTGRGDLHRSPVLTVGVDDIDDALRQVQRYGGKVAQADAAGTRHGLVCLRSRLRGQHDRAVPAGYERCRPVTGRPGTIIPNGRQPICQARSSAGRGPNVPCVSVLPGLRLPRAPSAARTLPALARS